MKNILISAPIKNRAWILPEYLKALKNIDYPKENISFLFLLNGSASDNSNEILSRFKEENEKEYKRIEILFNGIDGKEDSGEGGNIRTGRDKVFYGKLARLRNEILDAASGHEDIDYLFSVDSDVLVTPSVIKELSEAKKDIISALIVNDPPDSYNFLHFPGGPRRNFIPPSKVFEVYLTGAVYLISRAVFANKKIRYSEKYGTGEDLGFCESARQEGFKSFVLNSPQNHILLRRNINKCS